MRLTPERTVSDHPWIATELARHEAYARGGSKLVLRIGLSEEAPVGKIDGQVFIPRVEDDGIGPVIRVRGEISGPVRLVPSTAFMGIIKSGSTAQGTVEVRPLMPPNSTQQSPVIEVVGFAASPPGIRLSRDARKPALVHVTADSSELGRGRFQHDLGVKCRLDGRPCEVLLRISGMVSQ